MLGLRRIGDDMSQKMKMVNIPPADTREYQVEEGWRITAVLPEYYTSPGGSPVQVRSVWLVLVSES